MTLTISFRIQLNADDKSGIRKSGGIRFSQIMTGKTQGALIKLARWFPAPAALQSECTYSLPRVTHGHDGIFGL